MWCKTKILVTHSLIVLIIAMLMEGDYKLEFDNLLLHGLGIMLLVGYGFLFVPIVKHDWDNECSN